MVEESTTDRWGIYVDVEGFSAIYRADKNRALHALRELMEALYWVGRSVFANERIFIHQFGDGFVVVSNGPEKTPERLVAMSIAVMRHLIARGVTTKAAISTGDFSDIFGCYPEDIQAIAEHHRYVTLRAGGLMTIIPVMGSALIAPYKLSDARHGAVLLLETGAFDKVPDGIITRSRSPIMIDWIHSDFPLVKTVCESSGLVFVEPSVAEKHLRTYLGHNRLSKRWVTTTLESMGEMSFAGRVRLWLERQMIMVFH